MLDIYDREHVQPNVVDKDRAEDIIANLRAFFGEMRVHDVNVAKSREYVAQRGMGLIGGRGRSGKGPMSGTPATARRELTTLVAAVNHCIRHGHLPSEGFQRDLKGRVTLVELPPDSEPVTRWLTHTELASLRTACGETGRLRWWLEISYYTGSRRDAVERLLWFQVKMDAGRINLAQPGEAKTTKRRPIVPIDPQLRPWLEQMQAARDAQPQEQRSLFVLGSGVSVYRPFTEACKAAGLGPDVTPHVLRHTRATHLLQAGVSVFAVANLLGDTITTVERVYGSHSADFMAEILSKGS